MSVLKNALASRWFPQGLALLQLLRHLLFISYDYWDPPGTDYIPGFVLRDLARPFFEPYGFCGGWASYATGQRSVLGLDMPAYMIGVIVQMAMTGQESCIDALTTPRGQILTAVFVAPVWFWVGRGAQRWAQSRWRREAENVWVRAFLWLGTLPVLVSVLFALGTVASLVSGESLGAAIQAAGWTFWMLYFPALAAERLRAWPFHNVAPDRS